MPYEDTFIQPDVILTKNGKELYVEFFKTHLVGESKIEKIKILNKSTIEIDLNEIPILKDGIINKEEIRNNLINKVGNRWWLHNKEQEKLYKNHIDTVKSKIVKDESIINDSDVFDDETDVFSRNYIHSRPIHSKENLEIWKKKLKQQGFNYRKIYKYLAYDYDFNGRKTYSHTWENIYCPKLKSNSSRKTIELSDCRECELHKSMMQNEIGDWGVACGYLM